MAPFPSQQQFEKSLRTISRLTCEANYKLPTDSAKSPISSGCFELLSGCPAERFGCTREGSMKFIIGILLFVFIGVPIDVRSQSSNNIAAIRSIEETFRTAWLKNDEKTIMSLFTPDAALYPGSGEPLKGIDALRKYWFGPSNVVTAIDRFEVNIADVEGTDTFAAVTGFDIIHWSTAKKDGTDRKQFVSKGSFVALYKKIDARWRMHKRFAASKTEEITNGVKK